MSIFAVRTLYSILSTIAIRRRECKRVLSHKKGDGKLPEANRFTKTNVQKFYQPPQTGEHQLLEAGLTGPVRILATEELNVSL
ncbi:MAG: hypothetical protein ABIP48_09715 [Planctomycetota bacterium]